MLKTTARGLFLCLLVACGGEDGAYVGTYDLKGSWRLGGPFEGGKSVGDVARDHLIGQLASALPAPSFVEDKVRDVLLSTVGEPIRATVDSAMPPELAPGAPLTVLLGKTLAVVEIDSVLVLEGEKEGDFSGNEVISELRYKLDGKTYAVKASEIGGAGADIRAEWTGEETSVGSLSVERHSVKIGYGALVRHVLSIALGAAELAALEAKVSAAFACDNVVSAIVGSGTGVKISVAGWSHTVGASELSDACNQALSSLSKRTLGQFELDAPVEVGGDVSWQDQGAGSFLLSSRSFGGSLSILPEVIAPQVTVTFTGQRRQTP
jgi:hypothetical protein